MRFTKAYLPAGGYWNTPFCKWQGKFSSLHPVRFAAEVAKGELAKRSLGGKDIDGLVFGWTVPAKQIFYGAPWMAGLLGAPHVTGAMISQACATSAAALAHAAQGVECDGSQATLMVVGDKCSNGPHVYYPNPMGPGGTGGAENWVWDNFNEDPWARNSMIQTAENVAKEAGITREEMDRLTLRRFAQYKEALDSGFHARTMVSPIEVNPSGRKVVATVESDEGVFPTTKEGLEKLRPVLPGGTITFGTQTYPADGNAGMLVCSKERAKAWSKDGDPVQVLSFGSARVEKGFMAKAVVPAARRALDAAGVSIRDCKVVKTHNPFAVNDIYFAREMGIDAEAFNNYGCSLIYGHPQGPTGARLIAEGVEEARMNGGGHVLFAGCAAGDTAAAIVLKV